MNRGLVMTLCAAALAAGSLAQAQVPNVNLSLNLRYTHPAVPADGGTWYLVAKTDSAVGIAAVNAYISNINTAGITYGTPAVFSGLGGYTAVTGANIAAELNNSNQPFVVAGSPVNVVYFQDTANGPVIGHVGEAIFAQRQAIDPLRNTGVNTAPGVVGGNWNNATVVASGTFGATRPVFAPKGGNSTDANTLATAVVPSNNAIDANVTTTVRGDSVIPLGLNTPANSGLIRGDRNRNGTISFLADILPAYNLLGTVPAGTATWEQGDFNGNKSLSFLADILPAYNLLGTAGAGPSPAPTVGAVPEPATALMGLLGLGALAARRRMS